MRACVHVCTHTHMSGYKTCLSQIHTNKDTFPARSNTRCIFHPVNIQEPKAHSVTDHTHSFSCGIILLSMKILVMCGSLGVQVNAMSASAQLTKCNIDKHAVQLSSRDKKKLLITALSTDPQKRPHNSKELSTNIQRDTSHQQFTKHRHLDTCYNWLQCHHDCQAMLTGQ